MALLEAMACSTAAVCTAVGGVPEIVDEGVTGYLVPPKDPAALAERLADLLRSPDKMKRFGSAGGARVEAKFTLRASVSGGRAADAGCRRSQSRWLTRAGSSRPGPGRDRTSGGLSWSCCTSSSPSTAHGGAAPDPPAQAVRSARTSAPPASMWRFSAAVDVSTCERCRGWSGACVGRRQTSSWLPTITERPCSSVDWRPD